MRHVYGSHACRIHSVCVANAPYPGPGPTLTQPGTNLLVIPGSRGWGYDQTGRDLKRLLPAINEVRV
jgi:hypothetical protein